MTHVIQRQHAKDEQYISLLLPGWANGCSTEFLVDSGSTVTIISPAVFQQCQQAVHTILTVTPESLTLADGKVIPTTGRAEVCLEFGPLEFNLNVMIADIQCDAILGNDFLKPHGCVIDYKQGCVRIGNISVYYKEIGGNNTTCRVQVSKTVTIPAGGQAILPAQIQKRGKCSAEGLLQSTAKIYGKIWIDGWQNASF